MAVIPMGCKPSLEEAEAFAFRQLDHQTPASKSGDTLFHYGKCELNELLEFIYGERPATLGSNRND